MTSLLGIPWTNTSLTEVQIAPGKPWYPLNEQVAPLDKINFSASSSNSFVDIPGDSAWTYAVGEVSDEAKKLMEVSEKSLYIGLEQVKPGNRISDIGHAIQVYLENNGYGVPRDYTGHGVGKDIHEDPIIPNYGVANRGPRIAKGMVFAIEPMVTLGEYYTRTMFDDWTVKTIDGKITAHYEHTVAVTEQGYEILTKI